MFFCISINILYNVFKKFGFNLSNSISPKLVPPYNIIFFLTPPNCNGTISPSNAENSFIMFVFNNINICKNKADCLFFIHS